jgi:hypothetical protein
MQIEEIGDRFESMNILFSAAPGLGVSAEVQTHVQPNRDANAQFWAILQMVLSIFVERQLGMKY